MITVACYIAIKYFGLYPTAVIYFLPVILDLVIIDRMDR